MLNIIFNVIVDLLFVEALLTLLGGAICVLWCVMIINFPSMGKLEGSKMKYNMLLWIEGRTQIFAYLNPGMLAVRFGTDPGWHVYLVQHHSLQCHEG